VLFEKYIGLVRELGHLPVDGELKRKRRTDRSFPTAEVFLHRFGSKEKLIVALLAVCESGSGYNDIITLGKEYLQSSAQQGTSGIRAKAEAAVGYGYVYLMKSGRHYKIGHTNSVGRREWELGIKIPIPPKTVHYIKTDDPAGIEAYWHKRFSEKRGEGEWFDLSQEDVAAFKRWKRIA
jgi:Meiotically Up-regulated Gene 113 (MUG113) protein